MASFVAGGGVAARTAYNQARQSRTGSREEWRRRAATGCALEGGGGTYPFQVEAREAGEQIACNVRTGDAASMAVEDLVEDYAQYEHQWMTPLDMPTWRQVGTVCLPRVFIM